MNTIEYILELEKQEQEIRDKIKTLKDTLDPKGWMFCAHTHYREQRFSAWKEGNSTDTPCYFELKEGRLKLIRAGTYQDNWKEAEIVINKWWAKRF